MTLVVKSSFSSNSYSRVFFNEALEDLVYSIISFILNTSRMCKVLQSSGSDYVSLTEQQSVCQFTKSAHQLSLTQEVIYTLVKTS